MPRIDVALAYEDGRKEVVSVGRPADLIAFADEFDKIAPSEPYAVRELAWLAHRALKIEQPLDEWVGTLDDISSNEDEVAKIAEDLAVAKDPSGADEALPRIGPQATETVEAPATASETRSHG